MLYISIPAGLPLGATDPYGKRQIRITRYGGPSRVRQVRCDDCIQIVVGECIVDSQLRAKNWACIRAWNIKGIGGITIRLFCRFKDLLAVVNQFLPAMYRVEFDQISQRSHVCVSQRCEVLRDLRFEFIQQRGELVVGVCEYVTCVTVDDGCTQALPSRSNACSANPTDD